MKKALFTIAIALLATTATVAQEHERRMPPRPPFSPKEFQAKQREFITEKAELTAEEADAFFPEISGDVWKETGRECHSTDEKHLYPYRFVDYIRIKN